jgi:selenocysteine lyase/cysteine desulfurase
MIAGVRFATQLGPERIFTRIHDLAKQVRQRAAALNYVELLTPDDDRMYGSLVTLALPGIDVPKFHQLCGHRKIWIAQNQRLRVSTHIHTRPEDIDTLFATLADARKG